MRISESENLSETIHGKRDGTFVLVDFTTDGGQTETDSVFTRKMRFAISAKLTHGAPANLSSFVYGDEIILGCTIIYDFRESHQSELMREILHNDHMFKIYKSMNNGIYGGVSGNRLSDMLARNIGEERRLLKKRDDAVNEYLHTHPQAIAEVMNIMDYKIASNISYVCD